jgi:hypothetical protein
MKKTPVLVDWDGTGVEKLDWKRHPIRNSRKSPLEPLYGFGDFLTGVEWTGNVEVGGIVSRRRSWQQRQRVTSRSIADAGVEQFFTPENTFLLDNEKRKGRFIGRRALTGRIGFVEDRPHKLVPEIIRGFVVDSSFSDNKPHIDIVMGVVNHPKMEERIAELHAVLQETKASLAVRGVEHTQEGGLEISGTSLAGNFGILVVPLEPYSFDTGLAFANTLQEA